MPLMPRLPRSRRRAGLVGSSSGAAALAIALGAAACAPSHRVWPEPTAPVAGVASGDTPVGVSPEPHSEPRANVTPKGALSLAEARKYMVELINADRRAMGLRPVELDEGAPTKAGQAHAEDMAAFGYLGHWGLDGSVPEQRMTEAGGADMVLENASCFTDERSRSIDPEARIDPREIEHTESMFFHEQPPNDGHRKNILKAWHTKVGIGIAQPRRTVTEIPVPCFTQEFVDDYGSYGALPASAKVGDKLRVEGTMTGPARPVGVGLARVAAPRALPIADANARRSYPVPQPYEMYWTPGFVTKIPLVVKGERFAIDVPVDDHQKPGMYEVSVWAKLPDSPDYQIVSLRTLRVVER